MTRGGFRGPVLLILALMGMASCGGPGDSRLNRLQFENSPYLLQHADNPVDWYPWGDEAFDRAAVEGKPVFLSVGYSTCHWCHVMNRESFEDPGVAEFLNRHFISIKVDREERPDVDLIAMKACLLMTGQGGWPLTVVMTPERVPVFAGTYFPREDKSGRPGLKTLLKTLRDTWQNDPQKIDDMSSRMLAALQEAVPNPPAEKLSAATLEAARRQLAESFDRREGGFGPGPKFPAPHRLMFLMREWEAHQDAEILEMVTTTLKAMARGALQDHLGGGFHRYTVDAAWRRPHFEKMLFDQALLVMAYTEAYQVTGDPLFKATVERTLDYVRRELTSSEGGFFSAQDAESSQGEGAFYTWTTGDVAALLDPGRARRFCEVYGLSDSLKRRPLSQRKPLESHASDWEMSPELLDEELRQDRDRLFAHRLTRDPPSLDDKVLTDGNGLMIAALAKAGRVFGRPEDIRAARRATAFLLETLTDGDGELLHRYRRGEAGIPGYLDDYAFLTWGLLELYEATFDVTFLKQASHLNARMIEKFSGSDGLLYFTARDAGGLAFRPRQEGDGGRPAGHSVAALNMLRLSRMTGDTVLRDRVDRLLQSLAGDILRFPSGHAGLLMSLEFLLRPGREVILTGDRKHARFQALRAVLDRRFLPRTVIIHLSPEGPENRTLKTLCPDLASFAVKDEDVKVFLCENDSCQEPLEQVEELVLILNVKK